MASASKGELPRELVAGARMTVDLSASGALARSRRRKTAVSGLGIDDSDVRSITGWGERECLGQVSVCRLELTPRLTNSTAVEPMPQLRSPSLPAECATPTQFGSVPTSPADSALEATPNLVTSSSSPFQASPSHSHEAVTPTAPMWDTQDPLDASQPLTAPLGKSSTESSATNASWDSQPWAAGSEDDTIGALYDSYRYASASPTDSVGGSRTSLASVAAGVDTSAYRPNPNNLASELRLTLQRSHGQLDLSLSPPPLPRPSLPTSDSTESFIQRIPRLSTLFPRSSTADSLASLSPSPSLQSIADPPSPVERWQPPVLPTRSRLEQQGRQRCSLDLM